MTTLSEEIVAYESIQRTLELDHLGKWVVVHDKKLCGVYETFQSAAEDAVERFGAGPYLIRQVGTTSVTLPASILYKPQMEYASI